jgi:FkbM family methyltransferase
MINEFKLLVTSRYYGVPRSELRFAEQMVSQDFFKKCDGVLDIGANQGMFSTAMALTTTNVPIHAFEPLPSLQAKLRARVGRFPAVTVHASALGAAQGSADLNFGAFDEASSLLPMDQKHEEFFPGSSPTGKVRVDVITVDQFLALRPALRSVFMKLDVQGHGCPVISS